MGPILSYMVNEKGKEMTRRLVLERAWLKIKWGKELNHDDNAIDAKD